MFTVKGARYYIASIGRWNGVDALADQYPSTSPFAYVGNNPLSIIDPNGMQACEMGVGDNCNGHPLLIRSCFGCTLTSGFSFDSKSDKTGGDINIGTSVQMNLTPEQQKFYDNLPSVDMESVRLEGKAVAGTGLDVEAVGNAVFQGFFQTSQQERFPHERREMSHLLLGRLQ